MNGDHPVFLFLLGVVVVLAMVVKHRLERVHLPPLLGYLLLGLLAAVVDERWPVLTPNGRHVPHHAAPGPGPARPLVGPPRPCHAARGACGGVSERSGAVTIDEALVSRLAGALAGPAGDPVRAAALTELHAHLPACVRGLAWGDAAARGRCQALLRAWLTARRAGDEERLDLGRCTSTLAELVVGRDPSPEAELAADLLLRAASTHPQAVSLSLFVRWTEGQGPAFRRLVAGLEALDPAIVAAARREQPELHPVPAARVLEDLRAQAGPFLVVEGQTSPQPRVSIRVGVLRGAQVLFDGWIPPADLAALVEGLRPRGPVRRGEWDVMYATGWSLAWTDDGGPLEVWDREGLLLRQEQAALASRDGARCPVAEVARVHAYLEQGWVVRGVRCELRDGGALPVAEQQDRISELDPTYDGLSLMFEASWASSLAAALGKALGVPVAVDPPL